MLPGVGAAAPRSSVRPALFTQRAESATFNAIPAECALFTALNIQPGGTGHRPGHRAPGTGYRAPGTGAAGGRDGDGDWRLEMEMDDVPCLFFLWCIFGWGGFLGWVLAGEPFSISQFGWERHPGERCISYSAAFSDIFWGTFCALVACVIMRWQLAPRGRNRRRRRREGGREVSAEVSLPSAC